MVDATSWQPVQVVEGSFRDPSGFVFERNGQIYRQINHTYQDHYDCLINSGLYENLVQSESLIPHEEVTLPDHVSDSCYRIIRPERVPAISYPYEWCFSQLRDAALLTLRIQRRALDFGMSLKDASAFNIQFRRYRPILIDTLSFESRAEGEPWPAYRQFCQHFVAPLALASTVDMRLGQLMRIFIDGVPLDLASRLLGLKSWLRFGLLTHIHLHARSSQRISATRTGDSTERTPTVSTANLRAMIDSLISLIERLGWTPRHSVWADYYANTNYSEAAEEQKAVLIQRFVDQVKPSTVWDLGANTGRFTKIAADRADHTVAFDLDPAVVEMNYTSGVQEGSRRMLPLVMDLTNPSPDLGWAGSERMSLLRRGPVDLVMALALAHHLAIANNVPLSRIADYFSKISRWLIVEFVPKSDTQVSRMLSSRKDVFPNYTQDEFEESFKQRFSIIEREPISESERFLYLMQRMAQ